MRVKMICQACALMNCENVETEDIQIPRALISKNKKKGKAKLYTYKVLGIGEEFYKNNTRHGKGEGTEKSLHIRRGHIRRLKHPKYKKPFTWVRHTTVNKSSDRQVDKDYRIHKPTLSRS